MVMATEIARRGEHRLPLSSRSPRWLFAVGFREFLVGLHGSRWGGVAAWRGLAVGRGFGLIRDLHNPVFFGFFFFLDLPDLLLD